MITFENISKEFPDGTKAVHQFTTTVQKGEMFVLIGPSGCGKTTTLKMINRLIAPTNGTIYIEGDDINNWNKQALRWNIGYVLQQIALFPTMTIAENISVVPDMLNWSKKEISERVDELLHMVDLDPATYRSRKPVELSGGQQQRVGVLRALAADPNILIMDEPFSALDPLTREQLQRDVKELQSRIQKTIVFVTHDMDEALALGDRICMMNEGKIVQIGTPAEITRNPVNQFVKDFIGNRTNEWESPVKEIMDPYSDYIVNIDNLSQLSLQNEPIYVIDNDSYFLGRKQGHEVMEHNITLSPDMSLNHSIHYFDEIDVDVLPVVENNTLVGTMSYKNIVSYMKSTTLDTRRKGEI
ncbi:ATP-binding cassette domain-containing protein [Salibacterium salarium]|uniref:Carnitine transport ATP-binding protein OpuCA n=1 Tax=Salibacterium salarium TaxID=284579 RepID=A0A3R9P409_9BACI|nr:ABC transporter ATP-binding protein [Salibacterium salarium]RSL29820.1 ATP-binding cassette domain-containing protein [Salibacterium salarium]